LHIGPTAFLSRLYSHQFRRPNRGCHPEPKLLQTVQIVVARFIRKRYITEPLEVFVDVGTAPGLSILPQTATDEQWLLWLRKTWISNNHPASTEAFFLDRQVMWFMRLEICGRSMRRCCQLTQICGQLAIMLYALAERTADVIEKSSGNGVVEPWEYMYFRLD